MCDTIEAILILLGERGNDWEYLQTMHDEMNVLPFYSLS